MVGEQVEPGHDLRVADDEPEPPAGHPVRLRHREHLDADLLRARLGEEALRPVPVEDDVAVGEVVDDRGAGLLRVRDRRREGALGHADRARVRGVVQEDAGDVVARRGGEVGRPARVAVERHVAGASRRERGPGRVIRVVRIREDDRRPALGEHERELADRRLRPRHDRDLGVRVELDAVELRVASRDRLAQRRQPAKRRVPVSRLLIRRLAERVDHVLRRPDLGVPAPEVDERLSLERRVPRDLGEQRREVLLREALDSIRRRTHGPYSLRCASRRGGHNRAARVRTPHAPASPRRRHDCPEPRRLARDRARGRRCHRRSRARAPSRRPP